MSQSNAQIVSSVYAAFARGDVGEVLAALDPQVVWNEAESTPYADGNPYVGPQAVLDGVFGRLVSEWEGFSVTPERILDAGDTIVTEGRYRGTGRATGLSLDAQFVHVFDLDDGKITRFQQHTDTAQFNRVHAVVPPAPAA